MKAFIITFFIKIWFWIYENLLIRKNSYNSFDYFIEYLEDEMNLRLITLIL